MRLDHLLSREQAKAEMPELNRRSIGQKRRRRPESEVSVTKKCESTTVNTQRVGYRKTHSVKPEKC